MMSIGFLLHNQDEAVVWRGPRKNGLIKQFLQDVNWGDLDFLIIDSTCFIMQLHLEHLTNTYLWPSICLVLLKMERSWFQLHRK